MSVSGITSNLLNSLIAKYSGEQSDSASTTTTGSSTSTADTVSLSITLAELQSQLMEDAQSALFGTSSDDSTDTMTSVLKSAANAQMMKANPGLVEKLMAQSDSADSTSAESEIENIQSIDLLSVDTLQNLFKQNSKTTSTTDSSKSGTSKVV